MGRALTGYTLCYTLSMASVGRLFRTPKLYQMP